MPKSGDGFVVNMYMNGKFLLGDIEHLCVGRKAYVIVWANAQ